MKITIPIAKEFLNQSRAAFAIVDDVYRFLSPLANQSDILDQLESIFLLDDACQELLNVRVAKFVSNSQKARFILDLKDQQVVDYITLLSSIYSHALHDCLTDIQKQQKPEAKILLKLIARTLHYFGQKVKWNLFCYNSPSENTWQKINGAYHFAETLKLAEKSVFIFDKDSDATTAQDLFLRAHMLGVLRHGTLTPLEIEQAYEILQKFSNRINVRTAPNLNTVFVITLGTHEVANYYQDTPINSMQRFWSMQLIEATINQWRAALIAGYPPTDLVIKEFQLATMNKLIDAWKRKRTLPDRAERESVNIPTTCIIGFASIIKKFSQIEASNEEKSVKPPILRPEMLELVEKSPVVNKNIPEVKEVPIAELPSTILGNSSTGVLISIPITEQLNVELNSLVTWFVQNDSTTVVNLGIIRRLRHQKDHIVLAGIEFICENPLLTRIFPIKEVEEEDDLPHPPNQKKKIITFIKALLCQTVVKEQKKYILLTAQATPENKLNWKLMIQNKEFEFKIKDVIKHNSNWCTTNIQILTK